VPVIAVLLNVGIGVEWRSFSIGLLTPSAFARFPFFSFYRGSRPRAGAGHPQRVTAETKETAEDAEIRAICVVRAFYLPADHAEYADEHRLET
jgi:hypothetical protein